MSELNKASADAVEAARQGEQFAMMLAAVQAAQAAQQRPACGCQHGHQAAPAHSSWTPGKVAAVAAGVCVCGAVASMFFLAAAIAFPSIVICLLVLRSVWRDMQKGRKG